MNISDLIGGGIMRKIKGMQENVEKFQENLGLLQVSGTAGAAGIEVNVALNGTGKVTKVEISDLAWQEGRTVVEDLLFGAMNSALSKLQQEKRGKLSELGLPSSFESIGDLFAKSTD
ncbi:MAG: hypothetical protein COC15_02880 [Legionellales bacterium]|nr:MAG: hypothetical protein COC15_02880 [Legionellales bacterium]